VRCINIRGCRSHEEFVSKDGHCLTRGLNPAKVVPGTLPGEGSLYPQYLLLDCLRTTFCRDLLTLRVCFKAHGSFVLVCIGVQIPWNGVSALLVSLPLHIR